MNLGRLGRIDSWYRLMRLVWLRASNLRLRVYTSDGNILSRVSVAELRDRYIRENEEAVDEVTPGIATLLSTNRPERLTETLETLANQRKCAVEVIIATHGFEPSAEDKRYATELGLDPLWLYADSSFTLGEVYNKILERVTSPYVAKIDDDDYYGPYYMADSIRQLELSGADVTGKDAIFVYSQTDDATFIRMSHKHNRFVFSVAGGTIVTRTSTARDVGFISENLGEDQDFLTRIFDRGMRLYASSPFGFALNRGAHNTWDAGSEFLSKNATRLHNGEPGNFECVTISGRFRI